MASRDEQEALDAALDAALDDLEDETESDLDGEETNIGRTTATATAPSTITTADEKKSTASEEKEETEPSAIADASETIASSSVEPSTKESVTETKDKNAPFFGPPRPPEESPEPSQSTSKNGGSSGNKQSKKDPDRLFMDMMEEMMLTEQEGVEDSEEMMLRLMEKMQKQMQEDIVQQPIETPREPPSGEARSNEEKPKKSENTETPKDEKVKSKKLEEVDVQQQQQPPSPPPDPKKNEVDDAISNLIEGMAQQATVGNGVDDDNMPPLGGEESEILEMLMKGLEDGTGGPNDGGDGEGGDFNADAVIDGMMEQLLCKDLMYEPMKSVALKFPQWLAERRDSLSDKEYKEREKQCQCFQKLVHVYETNPNDSKQLMVLMTEVQEYGQPPPEIIKEIAPGLELDKNGLPQIDGTGMPFSEDGECRIM